MAQVHHHLSRGGPWMLLATAPPSAQWIILGGLGACLLAPDAARQVWHKLLAAVADAANANADSNTNNMGALEALARRYNNNNANSGEQYQSQHQQHVPSSIVIHTGGGTTTSNSSTSSLLSSVLHKAVSTVVTWSFVAGFLWVSVTVVSQSWPEVMQHILPVTRRVLDQTSKQLALSIYNVKQVLGQQLLALMKNQDALKSAQDETNRRVQTVHDEVQLLRHCDLPAILQAVDACQASVEATAAVQAHTARGVQLLVAAVHTVLSPHEQGPLIRELQHYQQQGEQQQRQLSTTTISSNSNSENKNNNLIIASDRTMEPPEQDHPLGATTHPPHYQQQQHQYGKNTAAAAMDNFYFYPSSQQQQQERYAGATLVSPTATNNSRTTAPSLFSQNHFRHPQYYSADAAAHPHPNSPSEDILDRILRRGNQMGHPQPTN